MPNVWTLLITDDCPEDREVYREYLLSDPHQSYRILEAGSAELGLALCQQERCDAILLDFCLPDMSGLEFLDQLKQQWVAPLPVIMLTGQGDERVAVQAMKRGAQDYLVKQDLQSDVLQLTVRKVIEQSSQPSQFAKVQDCHQLANSIALRIRQSLKLEQVLDTAVIEVQQLLECDRVVIYQSMPNSEPPLLKICESGNCGTDRDPMQQFVAFWVEQNQSNSHPVSDAIIKTGKHEKRHSSIVISRNRKQSQTYLITPIEWSISNTTQLWGLLIACQSSSQHQWQLDEINLLHELAGQLAIAIQQADQLRQIATDLERAKQLNAVQSQLTIALSHAYRTPLATILAAASTLKQQGDRLEHSRQQQFLQMIEDKVRQLSRLVEDLLIFMRVESGFEVDKAAFKPVPFNLLQFFADLIEEQQGIFNGDGAITTEDNGSHPSVSYELMLKITGNTKGFWGNSELLRQILVNLLSNAVKYSPQGGAVEVHVSGNESQIVFSVNDRGIGIPIEDQNHLFQAFGRGSNVGDISGAGLGLAIVKACVDLHRGEIAIDSQPEQGTTVTVRLPKR